MNATEPLAKQLEIARRDLLELSTQNRLLNTPRDQARGLCIEIKDESADQVFRMLVTDGSTMRFEQGELVAEADDSAEKPKRVTRKRATSKTAKSAPVNAVSSVSPEERQSDAVLHTELDPEELDRRLLGLVTDATATFQDQGVNVLYLALGFLKWFESDQPDVPRYAPLLLIPVRMERGQAGVRYSLTYTGDEIETNLTLKTRLKLDHGIDLPEIPETEELSPSVYFQDVRQQIRSQSEWEVIADDIVLWFFSFTKLLMYRDLDPACWPDSAKLQDRSLIRALLQDGFASLPPICETGQRIDSILDPANTTHVIDCDSSQTLVVEEVCRGRSLVIQGPPGTGKSQTITNLIASAVKAGKSILFVAEKMAALQVVQRRLANIGIGDMCLELHSEMASKKVVLDELARTIKLGRPKDPPDIATTIQRLTDLRNQLNRHADLLHDPVAPSGRSPYQIVTELVSLRAAGASLPNFQISDAETWTAEQFNTNTATIQEFADAWIKLVHPKDHPWRGCEIDNILPLDLERQLALAKPLIAALDELTQNSRRLAQQLGDDLPANLNSIQQLIRTGRTLLDAPKTDPQAIIGNVWNDQRATIGSLAEAGRTITRVKESLKNVVTEAAWSTDVTTAAQAYRSYSTSWFRILRSSFRQAKSTLKGLLNGPLPATNEERLAILDQLVAYQSAMRAVQDGDRLGVMAFGPFWQGKLTDWKQIDAWEAWDAKALQNNLSSRFRAMLASAPNRDETRAQLDLIEQQCGGFIQGIKAIGKSLKLNFAAAFGAGSENDDHSLLELAGAARCSLVALRERLQAWQERPEDLQHWQTYTRLRKTAESIAAGAIVSRMDDGELSPTDAPTTLRFAYHESLLRGVSNRIPELASFDGGKFQKLIDEFRVLDHKRLLLARYEVAQEHFHRMQKKRDAGYQEAVSVLVAELQKKRRQMPLRQLLARTGPAVQAIKPVFMMSPLSVAQFLEPGKLEFDLLLIDEASQVRPVEALGAAARCRQMVIVGDDKQMPPTQFFGVVVGDVAPADDEDDPQIHASDVESILGLCMARNMPQRMLRWHYRSRHQSLIAVSNQQFYEGQLYVVPSPERSGELGLKFRFVEQGRFIDRVNLEEAKVVAQAVMDHAKEHPQWTLGVGTFSVSQRDAVLKEVERLRRGHPETETFFDPSAPDPFFVKNLENIQGDERDVILVSVGYGPDENGRVNLNFGPVSSSGGERRLNVLMTRAKRRCEIFASIHAEDLDLTRATGRGPAVFRAFLEFAQRGGEVTKKLDQASEDRFINALRQQLQQRGYATQTRVGVAGIFIDLAVIDPQNEGHYLLGIEVDGPSYRDALTARDRDRLREQVLQGQGWQLYRIWSWEWFQRPTEQFNRLVEHIESARRGKPGASGSPAPDGVFTIDRLPSSGDFLGGDKGISTEGSAPVAANSESSGSSLGNAASELLGSLLKKGAEEVVQVAVRTLENQLQSATKPFVESSDSADEAESKSTKKTSGTKRKKKSGSGD